jgi:lysophosphatidate acyltransferase
VLSRVATIARVLTAFIVFVLYCVCVIPLALVLLPWRATRVRVFNRHARLLAAAVIGIAGVRLRVRNEERLQRSFPAIYVTNHVSAFDVIIGMRLCPVGGVGVMDTAVTRVPGYGQVYSLSGHAIIARAKPREAIDALREVSRFVKRHRLGIWILPEGGRSGDGRLRRFKAGFVHIAVETGLPVVPVVLHGVHRLWSRRRFPTLSTREIEVEVLPPVDTRAWRAETRREHAAEVQALFAAALHEDQKPDRLTACVPPRAALRRP